jgi:hypothetical protein
MVVIGFLDPLQLLTARLLLVRASRHVSVLVEQRRISRRRWFRAFLQVPTPIVALYRVEQGRLGPIVAHCSSVSACGAFPNWTIFCDLCFIAPRARRGWF